MEAILKVPYSYSDPQHDFDVTREIYLDGSIESQREWEKSKQEFEKKVVSHYRKYNPIITRNINKLGHICLLFFEIILFFNFIINSHITT